MIKLKSDKSEEFKLGFMVLVFISSLLAMASILGNQTTVYSVILFSFIGAILMPKGLKLVREEDGLIWFKNHFSPFEQSIDPKSITRIDYIYPKLSIECGSKRYIFLVYTLKRKDILEWIGNITNRST